MPFLKNQRITTLGSVFSLSALLCTMLIGNQNFQLKYHGHGGYLIVLFILILFSAIFIWWRNQLYQTYLQRLRERETKRLEQELEDCRDTITSLKEENQELAKLIHRDNKQIASLQLAVETFLSMPAKEYETQMETGRKLLQELQKENKDRKEMVSDLTRPSKQFSTNILFLDSLLNYMGHRCQKEGIRLDFSSGGNLHYFMEECIREQDLKTLLADLLENALIATKHNKGKDILLHMGIVEEDYVITVWDSGIPFTMETLFRLGRKQYTTHKEDGGSGIGLMSTYELMEKYHASLYIEEYPESSQSFSKKIAIHFDGREEYHLFTGRREEELAVLRQREDLHIESTGVQPEG